MIIKGHDGAWTSIILARCIKTLTSAHIDGEPVAARGESFL